MGEWVGFTSSSLSLISSSLPLPHNNASPSSKLSSLGGGNEREGVWMRGCVDVREGVWMRGRVCVIMRECGNERVCGMRGCGGNERVCVGVEWMAY